MDIDSLRAAVAVSPDNIPLLQILAKALEDTFEINEAKNLYERIIKLAPSDVLARLGLVRILDLLGETSQAVVRLDVLCENHPQCADAWLLRARIAMDEEDSLTAGACYAKAVELNASLADETLLKQILQAGGSIAGEQPKRRKITHDGTEVDHEDDRCGSTDDVLARELDLELRVKNTAQFADVGGMEAVKEQIRMKIIFPLQNPALFASYGKKAGGGVLLYGPPGCGKTLMARATAGEIGANFFAIGIHHILNMYIGESENKLHKIFELARRNSPAVLFFDEMDALAADRRDMRQSAGRHLINQFLQELDGAIDGNDNILILGATNAPWHVDNAFLRPGRFDRIIFVPPPDIVAREEICRIHAKGRPLANWDEKDIAKRTEGLSGADIKAVFDNATEVALTAAMRKGAVVPITGNMLTQSAKEVKPSTRKWFESAKNYALYANQGGLYDEILVHLGIKK
jgi:transitional endoplasmic reticulum ATPase